MNPLSPQFDKIEWLIKNNYHILKDSSVSDWSVGQHLDHLLKIHNSIFPPILSLEKNPTVLRNINILGRLILFIGRLPRGKVQSPEAFLGRNRESGELLHQLEICRNQYEEVMSLDFPSISKKAVLNHPYFRGLNVKQWMRFLFIHNNHHFRIIDKITARKDSLESH